VRLLIDINVLLDVALQRPEAASSARVLAQCGKQHEAWLAWHSIATLAYLIERQTSNVTARDFIRDLLGWAQVAATSTQDAVVALDLPLADFEDALQVAAAMACGAQFIITRNERDFKKSPVPALSPDAFLRRHGPCRRAGVPPPRPAKIAPLHEEHNTPWPDIPNGPTSSTARAGRTKSAARPGRG
jgi:predicted nucleic acid-binding protein